VEVLEWFDAWFAATVGCRDGDGGKETRGGKKVKDREEENKQRDNNMGRRRRV
jgi:hypothetical protein